MIAMQMKKRGFRKQFKKAYHNNFKKMEKIKLPWCYAALLLFSMAYAIVFLSCAAYAYLSGRTDAVIPALAFLPVEAVCLIAASKTKWFFPEYDRKLSQVRMAAIDRTFEDIWGGGDVLYKEHCITVFEKNYKSTWGSVWNRVATGVLSGVFTLFYIVLKHLLPDSTLESLSMTIAVISVMFEAFGRNIPIVAQALNVDELYLHVGKDYRAYLAKLYVDSHTGESAGKNGGGKSCGETEQTAPEKRKYVLIGAALFLFPIAVICMAKFFQLDPVWSQTVVLYAGSITGGLLTLAGVHYTIKDSSRKRQEDLEMQYMPVLKESIVPYGNRRQLSSEIIYGFHHPGFDDAELDYGMYQIQLENAGRGEITQWHMKVKDVRLLRSDGFAEESEIQPDAYILCDGNFEFVPINGCIYLYIGIPKLRADGTDNGKSVVLDTTIGVSITGIIGRKEYEYQLHYLLTLRPGRRQPYECELSATTFCLIRDDGIGDAKG